MTKRMFLVFALLATVSIGIYSYAQNTIAGGGVVATQSDQSKYYLTPISSTAAVNNQVTLTIPAPSGGLSNYVCELRFTVSQDATSTVQTNAVTTSTNFNSFALKYSHPATVNLSLIITALGPYAPSTGCVKSTVPGTATTFVSPAAAANAAFTWYATYYQAP